MQELKDIAEVVGGVYGFAGVLTPIAAILAVFIAPKKIADSWRDAQERSPLRKTLRALQEKLQGDDESVKISELAKSSGLKERRVKSLLGL